MLTFSSRRIAVFIALAAFAFTGCGPGDNPRALKVESVTDLGPLSMPATVPGRDGGWSGLVFGKLFWTFGDSFITVKGEDGLNVRSSTSAWSASGSAFGTALTEPLTSAGIPYQLVPYTSDELAANQADSANGWALWGGPVLFEKNAEALFLYSRVKRENGSGFNTVSVGVARVSDGATTARRDPSPLFAQPEPLYGNGSAYVDEQYVYLYQCDVAAPLDMACAVARAPRAQADHRSAYVFYDGAQWVSDISKARPVVHGAAAGFSVDWNDWLGCYVAVHSELLGKGIRLRTAPAPEGPWSEAITLPADGTSILPNTDGEFGNYLAVQHRGLGSADGRELVVTYSRPLAPFRGEVRAARIRLAE
ncbi:MAG: DUF4185 domain-containing protein [Deltaproteobacteria bacterium]|nr:DUF4185 domain-containing protein [Deltaproteobacteria bacterium]